MSAAGQRILRGARQALAFVQGRADVGQYRVHIPADIDVRVIPKKFGMTREVLGKHFGVDRRIVRDWEQGRLMPTGAERALLTVMNREPEAVRRALRWKSANGGPPLLHPSREYHCRGYGRGPNGDDLTVTAILRFAPKATKLLR